MNLVGIDPGPIVGISLLWLDFGPSDPVTIGAREAMQVTPGILVEVLNALTADAVAVERFVVGPRAGRSGTPTAGATAREVVDRVERWAARDRCPIHLRSAAEVKPWATDARLGAAGLLVPTVGMGHARDAARHALYAAVKSYGLPDPLSARAGA